MKTRGRPPSDPHTRFSATTSICMLPEQQERLQTLMVAYGLRSYSAVIRMLVDQAYVGLTATEA